MSNSAHSERTTRHQESTTTNRYDVEINIFISRSSQQPHKYRLKYAWYHPWPPPPRHFPLSFCIIVVFPFSQRHTNRGSVWDDHLKPCHLNPHDHKGRKRLRKDTQYTTQIPVNSEDILFYSLLMVFKSVMTCHSSMKLKIRFKLLNFTSVILIWMGLVRQSWLTLWRGSDFWVGLLSCLLYSSSHRHYIARHLVESVNNRLTNFITTQTTLSLS
jgi:hypothetical protein